MIMAKQVNTYPIQMTNKKSNNDPPYALIIILGFFTGGTLLSYFYPIKEEQYIIFLATIAITIFLVIAYIYPIPPDAIESKLSWANNLLGV
jgi:sortase A